MGVRIGSMDVHLRRRDWLHYPDALRGRHYISQLQQASAQQAQATADGLVRDVRHGRHILGMNVARNRENGSITISQKDYT